MITLEVQSGQASGAVHSFDLDVSLVSLGRGPQNRVVLPDYHLSGEHGQIFREDDRYIYRDLKSTNGSRIVRPDGEIILDGEGNRWEIPLEDGDQIVLGSPAEPVTLICRIRVDEDARDADRQEVIAERRLADLPAVEVKVQRDPARAAALYDVARRLGRRGLDLNEVFAGLAEATFELLPRATHMAIDLAD